MPHHSTDKSSWFKEKLANLGFATYEDYLRGEHWRDFKSRYRNSGLPIACVVCGESRIQLHHHTYRRFGEELLTDVTPLCREHHVVVHELLNVAGKSVSYTPVIINDMLGKPIPKKPRRKKNPKKSKAKPGSRPRCHGCNRIAKRGTNWCGIHRPEFIKDAKQPKPKKHLCIPSCVRCGRQPKSGHAICRLCQKKADP